jgi:uncharacterized protein (UPF0335 family)
MTADKQLKAYVDRVLRLKEEQDTLGDDIREVYAEAKGEGYDKTVMGKLVAHLRKVAKSGEDAVSEQADIFDTYLTAYHRASGTAVATHTHEENYYRETGEVLDTNPRLIKQVVDGMQTAAGRAALIAAVDIMIDREEEEHPASHGEKTVRPEPAASFVEEIAATIPPETANETVGGFPVAAAPTSAEETGAIQSTRQGAGMERGMYPGVTGGESAANNSEMDRATEGSFETGSEAAEKGREAIPAGPEGVDLNHAGAGESPVTEFAPASHGEAEAPSLTAADQPQAGDDDVTAQAAAKTNQAGSVSKAPATFTLRPNCLRPESCAGHGTSHCHACKVAMREGEAA